MENKSKVKIKKMITWIILSLFTILRFQQLLIIQLPKNEDTDPIEIRIRFYLKRKEVKSKTIQRNLYL